MGVRTTDGTVQWRYEDPATYLIPELYLATALSGMMLLLQPRVPCDGAPMVDIAAGHRCLWLMSTCATDHGLQSLTSRPAKPLATTIGSTNQGGSTRSSRTVVILALQDAHDQA